MSQEPESDWEFATIGEELSSNITEADANRLFDEALPLTTSPGERIEVRHLGKVIREHHGRYATQAEIDAMQGR